MPQAQPSRDYLSRLRHLEDAGAKVRDRVLEAGRNVFRRHPEVRAVGVERGPGVVSPATGAVRGRSGAARRDMDAAKRTPRCGKDIGRAGIVGSTGQREDDPRRPGGAMHDGRVDQVFAGSGHVALSSNGPGRREFEPGDAIARCGIVLDVDRSGQRTPRVPAHELTGLQATIVRVQEGA